MINFRFHIVSLTAVLLALGIGLVLGTTFLKDATVDTLNSQLSGLERDLDNAKDRNTALRRQLSDYEDEASGLDEQLGERLFAGLLRGDPVLVLAPAGIDDKSIAGVTTALDQADADLLGVWRLTDRLKLDDDGKVADLATALGLRTDDVARLRSNLATQLADVLYGAVDLPAGAGPAGASAGTQVAAAAPAEPEIVARLAQAGFIHYDLPEGATGKAVLLPPAGLRVVIVSGPDAAVPADDVLLPMLGDLTSEGPAPVVAAEPSAVPGDQSGQSGDKAPVRLVKAIRDDDKLGQRVSTVDDLDRVAGRVATVLALVDARPGNPVVGHYGTEGGTRLLPPPEGTGS